MIASPSVLVVALGLGWSLVASPASAQEPSPERAPPRDVADDAPPPEVVPESLRAAIARRFAGEPDVLSVVRCAVLVSGLDRATVRARARRGRRSALLPDVRLGATRARGVGSSQSTSATDPSFDRDDDLRLEATLTFALSRLVYGPDETAWAREERAVADAIAGLVREVVELYYRRRRLIIEIELLGEEDEARLVALAETTALLEVFTDGNFFRIMAEDHAMP